MPVNLATDLTAQPCSPWATVDQFQCNEKTRCGGSPCPDDYISPWTDAGWLDWATSILFNLTGRRFSVCTRTVTPAVVCACSARSQMASITLAYGGTLQAALNECGTPACSGCGRYPVIDLGGDVTAVTSVTFNGDVVDDALYRIDGHRWLVRLADTDGVNPGWDQTHRYDLTTGDDTLSVVYETGVEPPPGGAQACVALACALRQMVDGMGNVGALKGQTVNSVNTRGVSAQTEGLLKGLRAGKSGIGAVDAFLAVWLVKTEDDRGRNITPGGVVWSPDLEDVTPKHTTWRA